MIKHVKSVYIIAYNAIQNTMLVNYVILNIA